MMAYWPWWLSGLALALLPVLHWVLTRRLLAVSGAFTAIIDRIRYGAPGERLDMRASMEDLVAALQQETRAEFGEHVTATPSMRPGARLKRLAPRNWKGHLLLLAGLVVGALLSTLLAGKWSPTASLSGDLFNRLTHNNDVLAGAVLLVGGILVGFGTRMAGGCTSGHGLSGVSRAQPGSLAATAAFFATGIVVSFALGALL